MILDLKTRRGISEDNFFEEMQYQDFQEQILNLKRDETYIWGTDIYDISGWYKTKEDEELVNMAREGRIEDLNYFIKKDGPDKEDENKQRLIDLRFDVDGEATKQYKDASGWCLLNVAASKGNIELLNFLVDDVGMDVNTICYGVTPVFCCFPSMHGTNFSQEKLNTAKKFYEKGADLDHKVAFSARGKQPSGLSVIHTATLINQPEDRHSALEFLGDKMQDANSISNNGNNALHYLIMGSSDDFDAKENDVRLLISKGVDPDHRNNSGASPDKFLQSHVSKQRFRELSSLRQENFLC